MICRIWRGWTTKADAAAYEAIVRGEVIPAIEARAIPGFRHIDLIRDDNLADEVEFRTMMWFDDEASIIAFVGAYATVSHVPVAARAFLKRFDERARHFQIVDRRAQG